MGGEAGVAKGISLDRNTQLVLNDLCSPLQDVLIPLLNAGLSLVRLAGSGIDEVHGHALNLPLWKPCLELLLQISYYPSTHTDL